MRSQRKEICHPKQVNSALIHENNSLQDKQEVGDDCQSELAANEQLKIKVIKYAEQAKVHRQCIAISLVGFFVCAAIILSHVVN